MKTQRFGARNGRRLGSLPEKRVPNRHRVKGSYPKRVKVDPQPHRWEVVVRLQDRWADMMRRIGLRGW